jgi:hypothetical protein
VLGVGDGSGVAVGDVPTGPDTVGVGVAVGVAVLLDGVDWDGLGVERDGEGVGEVRDGAGDGDVVAWCTGCEVLTGSGVVAVAVRGLT